MKIQTLFFRFFLSVFFIVHSAYCFEVEFKKSKDEFLKMACLLGHEKYEVESLHGGNSLPVIALCSKNASSLDGCVSSKIKNSVFIWNCKRIADQHCATVGAYAITCLPSLLKVSASDALSRDGSKLAQSKDGGISIFDTATGKVVQQFEKLGGMQSSWKLQFSPDEKKIIAESNDGGGGGILLAAADKKVFAGRACCGQFSPDSKFYLRVTSWGAKKEVILYDAVTGGVMWNNKDPKIFFQNNKETKESSSFGRWSLEWRDEGKQWAICCGQKEWIANTENGVFIRQQEKKESKDKDQRVRSVSVESDGSLTSAMLASSFYDTEEPIEESQLLLSPKDIAPWSFDLSKEYGNRKEVKEESYFFGWPEAGIYMKNQSGKLAIYSQQ